MAQIIVRNLEESTKAQLQSRAARHGRSMEEEVRDILRDAVKNEAAPPAPLGTRFASFFNGIGLDQEILEQRGQTPRPAEFEP